MADALFLQPMSLKHLALYLLSIDIYICTYVHRHIYIHHMYI